MFFLDGASSSRVWTSMEGLARDMLGRSPPCTSPQLSADMWHSMLHVRVP